MSLVSARKVANNPATSFNGMSIEVDETNLVAALAAIDGDITEIESDIAAIDARVGDLETAALDFEDRIASLESAGPAAVDIKQTEVDFGTTPVWEQSFTVVDGDVSAGSQLIGNVAYEAPTGKDLDEMEMDGLDLKFAPGVGQFTLYARGLDGPVHDKFKINYLIG